MTYIVIRCQGNLSGAITMNNVYAVRSVICRPLFSNLLSSCFHSDCSAWSQLHVVDGTSPIEAFVVLGRLYSARIILAATRALTYCDVYHWTSLTPKSNAKYSALSVSVCMFLSLYKAKS